MSGRCPYSKLPRDCSGRVRDRRLRTRGLLRDDMRDAAAAHEALDHQHTPGPLRPDRALGRPRRPRRLSSTSSSTCTSTRRTICSAWKRSAWGHSRPRWCTRAKCSDRPSSIRRHPRRGPHHPSGDPEPSPEARECTRRLKQGGELLGIRLLDHFILGADGDYVSLKARGDL